MAQVVTEIPGEALRSDVRGGAKPRIEWDQFADGRAYLLTPEDYDGKVAALATKARYWARANRKVVTYRRDGENFYFQVIGSMTPEQVAATETVEKWRSAQAAARRGGANGNGASVPTTSTPAETAPAINPFAA